MSKRPAYKFEPNILKLSKTKEPRELHKEWRFTKSYKKTKTELPSTCICQHDMRDVYYYFNTITQRVITVGSTCAKKLKQLIKGNGSPKSVMEFANLEPGTYSEISNVDKYSDECRAEACALLRVEIGRSTEEQLRAFLCDPEQLINDAGLIAYAKERLAELEAERKEKERQRQQQFDAFLETMRLEREARESAERLEKERKEARIQALQMEEELSQIDEMRDEWGNVNRIVKTADELKDEEELYEAQQMLNYWSEKPLLLKSNIMLLLEKVIEKHLGKMEEDKKQRIEERRQRIEERRQRILEKDKDLMRQTLSWAEKMMRFNTEHGI